MNQTLCRYDVFGIWDSEVAMRTFDKTKTYPRKELSLDSPDLLEYARCELSRSRHIHIRISGSSMRPMIDDGDIVTIAPIEADTINAQDIVLVTTQCGTALVHRVISLQAREGELYALTRGDYSRYHDTPLPLSRVLGRVVALQRKGKGKVVPVRPTPNWLSRIRAWLSQFGNKAR